MGITNVALGAIPDLLGDVNAIAAFDYIAVGTSDAAFSAGQLALIAELTGSGLERIQVTTTLVTTIVASDTLQLTNSFSVTDSVTVAEVGIFNDSTTGSMLARTTTAKTLENGDTYTPVYKIRFS